MEELEIIKAQKIEEERLQKEKDADEATLAMMRAEKKGYYESYRKSFLMQQPFEVRLNLFFKFYTVNFKSNGLETDKKKMESVQVWQDLFGVKMIDKKHVFTDQEFETFFARCKDVGVYCPYDLFIKHALEHHVPNRENAVADKHRHDLYNQA